MTKEYECCNCCDIPYGEDRPCRLKVDYDEIPPTRCPYDPEADKYVSWRRTNMKEKRLPNWLLRKIKERKITLSEYDRDDLLMASVLDWILSLRKDDNIKGK